jgi:hypothetical protein
MLIFLAVIIFLLLKNDEDIPIAKKDIVIHDPEELLAPSSSQLLIFKNAAVSSDSQVCSDMAR